MHSSGILDNLINMQNVIHVVGNNDEKPELSIHIRARSDMICNKVVAEMVLSRLVFVIICFLLPLEMHSDKQRQRSKDTIGYYMSLFAFKYFTNIPPSLNQRR